MNYQSYEEKLTQVFESPPSIASPPEETISSYDVHDPFSYTETLTPNQDYNQTYTTQEQPEYVETSTEFEVNDTQQPQEVQENLYQNLFSMVPGISEVIVAEEPPEVVAVNEVETINVEKASTDAVEIVVETDKQTIIIETPEATITPMQMDVLESDNFEQIEVVINQLTKPATQVEQKRVVSYSEPLVQKVEVGEAVGAEGGTDETLVRTINQPRTQMVRVENRLNTVREVNQNNITGRLNQFGNNLIRKPQEIWNNAVKQKQEIEEDVEVIEDNPEQIRPSFDTNVLVDPEYLETMPEKVELLTELHEQSLENYQNGMNIDRVCLSLTDELIQNSNDLPPNYIITFTDGDKVYPIIRHDGNESKKPVAVYETNDESSNNYIFEPLPFNTNHPSDITTRFDYQAAGKPIPEVSAESTISSVIIDQSTDQKAIEQLETLDLSTNSTGAEMQEANPFERIVGNTNIVTSYIKAPEEEVNLRDFEAGDTSIEFKTSDETLVVDTLVEILK